MNNEEKQMYDFAYKLTKSAGSKLKLERQKNSVIEIREKTSQMDIVTEHDILIERFLVENILEKYPGHGIVAEENRAWTSANIDGYRWVIDPIDGTVNYYRLAKGYAISLALYRNETPIFGLVYDVAKEVMFAAGHGEGAAYNGCSLDVLPERQERLNQAVVAISLRTIRELVGLGVDVLGMLSGVQAHRYLGCASLELCMVANGEYDLFISSNVYEWDVAAARIFLEQRGGFFLSRRKAERSSCCGQLFAAAFRSPSIWEEALAYFPPCIRKNFC